MKKLQYMKHKLIAWNRNVFGHLSENKNRTREDLHQIDDELEDGGGCLEDLKGRRVEKMGELERVLKVEDLNPCETCKVRKTKRKRKRMKKKMREREKSYEI